jgi:hypothetical protein
MTKKTTLREPGEPSNPFPEAGLLVETIAFEAAEIKP